MPVINFSYEYFNKVLGEEIPRKKLIELLPMIGSDIEHYDDENVKVEFFPNRPDYYSVDGIARTVRGFLGIETGLPDYKTSKSGYSMTVDPELELIRPFTSCCIVEGIFIDEDGLKDIMDFQEDLHWVLGRDRKKVAIGIHNLDVLTPPFNYIAAEPKENSFIALETTEEQNLDDILFNHKKGKKYSHLIEKFDKYPLIKDSKGNVLSMPPIINGELTKLTENSVNVLIDVTGTDERAVNFALNIIATSFAEAGGKIKTIDMVYKDRTVETPDLSSKTMNVNIKTAEKILGVDLDVNAVVKMLERVRLGAKVLDSETVACEVPAYRIDILHEVDIIENIAIGHCIKKIEPELPEISTIAYPDNARLFENRVREIMIGMGFYEVMSLMLTSEDEHYKNLRLDEDDHVMVSQPISQDRTMIRKSLINGLMEFLEDNKHEELPQKIFEVGDVAYIDEAAETGTKIIKKIACAVTHSTANFTEIKSITDAFILNLGLKMEIETFDHPAFIRGRCARVEATGEAVEGSVVGYFGEVDPEVITNFELEYPVVAFEMEFKS
ncbi:Phenylalanyl-tRNA synthetase beta chain [Methanobacterium lacus]|uniref:Phenylalanine--tRNA ligase beta subunit n=1 Tax=Methanobacterium lacus (strain AL-21) TaxID=877455 RepID=F0TC46_METLA|nr:phenylalanine--tRNA ligase subunit beta [Methanobacterium lacus]ADZ09197.1 Phenylalanyl-tRNA synthetase beta chain [Methanobacterium lacus]